MVSVPKESWAEPIKRYLEEGTLLVDKKEAQRLVYKAARYTLIDGVLYKRGFSMPLLRCVEKEEALKFNDAIHKGMPHKFYHGRTGRVWNITKRAIGVEVNKQVGNRIIKKRIHVRVEHVQPSRCTEEFRNRKLRNDKLKAEAKFKGEAISTKRQPEGPKPGLMVEGAQLETVTPIPYDVVNDLKGGY
ncbi:large ribosomal subunit protein eL21x/eL21w-like [Humulus lupulus]|uniref:large ribosomal subunit protein eL21x/eL21w-like n=1 Tax=Humulus lupulus TaxID=3486 RepID=UPI002B4093CF|nr:large ribosomal subunit protein eL21x/eL21w-like [Humulus lupulus]